MIGAASDWLAMQGITLPHTGELIEAAVAGAIIAAAIALGILADRQLGSRAAGLWERHLGHQADGMRPRLCRIIRYGTTAILLAIAENAWPWQHPAALLIGIMLGAATAIAVSEVLRGARLPRMATWLMALFVFSSILSHSLGGLEVIQTFLSRIGFDVGSRRFSLLSLLTVAVTVIIIYTVVRLANRFMAQFIRRTSGLDATQKLLFEKLAGIAIIVAAFFFGIDLLQINLTTFAVFSGALGLAVGFGLQKTVGNLIAGIILLMDRSIKPGDVIVVGDSFGWVNKIGVRAVSVITRDGKEHLIPNENLMTQEVENWSYTDRNVRVRIPVGVSYGCDLKLAQELMLRAARESPRVLDSPPPNVWLAAFGDSSVDHEILAWISDPESGVGNVRSDVLNRLWWLFKEHGIEIPLPQRDVHVRDWPSPAAPQ
ncbi:mechanosensitive ion channel family protein [Sphingomonas sp. RS6]